MYGSATSTTVSRGGREYVEKSGVASGTIVDGYAYVEVGGSATGATIGGGGEAIVYGKASGTIVGSGGVEYVESGGTNSGGTVASGGKLVVYGTDSGTTIVSGTMTVSGGTIGSGAIVETASGGTVSATGTVTNSGTLFASGAGSTVDIIGVVNGGSAEVGNGIVDIKASSSENVSFRSGGSGGLQLDHALAGAYSGKVSGFGEDTKQFIDLTQINSPGATLSYKSANPSNTSGTLTVKNGATSATISMIGTYTLASFKLGHDASGHVEITDPPVAAASVHSANLALLGNYIAASFVSAAFDHGGTVITEAAQAANQQPLLTHPHTG